MITPSARFKQIINKIIINKRQDNIKTLDTCIDKQQNGIKNAGCSRRYQSGRPGSKMSRIKEKINKLRRLPYRSQLRLSWRSPSFDCKAMRRIESEGLRLRCSHRRCWVPGERICIGWMGLCKWTRKDNREITELLWGGGLRSDAGIDSSSSRLISFEWAACRKWGWNGRWRRMLSLKEKREFINWKKKRGTNKKAMANKFWKRINISIYKLIYYK